MHIIPKAAVTQHHCEYGIFCKSSGTSKFIIWKAYNIFI